MHDDPDTGAEARVTGLVFPCVIDIKLFLHARENNVEFVRDVLLQSISADELLDISSKESRNGKYQSYSCRVNARDRGQMDDLYVHLSSHADVLMVI